MLLKIEGRMWWTFRKLQNVIPWRRFLWSLYVALPISWHPYTTRSTVALFCAWNKINYLKHLKLTHWTLMTI